MSTPVIRDISDGAATPGDEHRSSAKAFALDLVKDPSKLRDAALILGGLIYLSGYSVWSVLAWLEGLGPVPVLDSQYFVAGLPTVAGLVITVVLTLGVRHLLVYRWPEYVRHFEPHQRRWLKIITVVVGLVSYFIVSSALEPPKPERSLIPQLDALTNEVAMAYYRASEWFRGRIGLSTLPGRLQQLCTFVLVFAVLFTLYANFELNRPREWAALKSQGLRLNSLSYWLVAGQLRALRLAAVYLLPLLIGWSLLNLYVQDVYMNMPQALGGARARPAVLDVRASEFSDATLQALGIQRPDTAKDDWVATSHELNVRYATDTMIIVEPLGQQPGSVRFFELSRDGVHSVRWTAARQGPAPTATSAGTKPDP